MITHKMHLSCNTLQQLNKIGFTLSYLEYYLRAYSSPMRDLILSNGCSVDAQIQAVVVGVQ